ncbi:hypothetical protein GCM10023185_29800 [Hymenobacter saemangeumensis]|uniref:Uncharacterized protein n=1 Tax=Hymenobacter saemangeumensis TaxID=1084522 RepID=A0ABP8ILR2_9BACT
MNDQVVTTNTASGAVVSSLTTPYTDYYYNFTTSERQPYVNGVINASGATPIRTWGDSIQIGPNSTLRRNRYRVRVLTATNMQFEQIIIAGATTMTVAENYRR